MLEEQAAPAVGMRRNVIERDLARLDRLIAALEMPFDEYARRGLEVAKSDQLRIVQEKTRFRPAVLAL